MAITGAAVDADHVAGHKLEIFKRQCVRAVGALCAGLFKQADLALLTAIYGIVHMDIEQSELSGSLDANRDFLDRICAIIASWTVERDLGRLCLVGGNKIIL